MEIGPNLCVWPIQSGINHELNSMQTLSPIVQQNNSFVYSRSNNVVLELESDSETELESTPHLDHHDPIESKHQENPCQSQWNTRLINLSTDEDEEDYNQCIDNIDIHKCNVHNNLNDNIINNHGNTVDRQVELEKQLSIDHKNHQNLQNFHDKTDDNDDNNNNNKDYTCGFCGFDFGTAEQVEEHVLLKHSDNLTTSNYSRTASTNTSDSSPTVLTNTIITTSNNSSSNTVTITKNSKHSEDPSSKFSNLRSIAKESRKSLKNDNEMLKEFDKTSSTAEMDDQQLIRSDNHFPALVTNNPMITDCPLCDRTFVGRRSLNIHLNKTHSIKENGNNINNNTNSNSIDNPGSIANNTDAQQLKINSVSKLTRLACSRSLRGFGGNKNNDVNNNINKTTNETTKSTSEKSLCKIVVRPPILPRPSRMTNSMTGSSTSPSKINVDKKNLQSESLSSSSSTSQDISVSRNNESEELNPQKSRPTVYAVSPPLATEQSGLKLRIISLDAVKKSTNTYSTLHNVKNDHLDKTHLTNDIKLASVTCPSPSPSPSPSSSSSSSSSAAKSSLTTRITLKKFNTDEKYESAFTSLHSSSLYRKSPVNINSKEDDCCISNISQSPSLQRAISYPLDSNEAYNFGEVDHMKLKYNFSPNNKTSLQLDLKSSNLSDLSTGKSEAMDTSLRTSDGLYKCRICKRLFANRYSLTGHYKSHYEPSQKPYCCDDCGQRYTSPSNLHYHRGRNCPVLKLKAIKEGKLIPSSVQNTKLLELKALRAVERKALMNKLKDQNDANSHEVKDNIDEVEQHQPSANKKSRSSTCKFDNNCVTTSKIDSSIKCLKENMKLKSPNSPYDTISPRPTISDNIGNGVNDIGNMTQENENSLQIQEIVRLFLMHAYQSDELRQQLLSLTSNALLTALLPTNGFNSNMFMNPNSTSNQQLFNLLSSFINSNCSPGRTINNDQTHDNSNLLYMQQKSAIETPPMQSNCLELSTEEPTDLTSTSHNCIRQNNQSNSSGIQCSICRQDSHVFQDIQGLQEHMIAAHSKYNRSLSETTTETVNLIKPLMRCHSLSETVPSNIDWNMKTTSSMPTTPNILLQQHYRHHQPQQEQEQPINYSENLSINNYNSPDTTEQSASSSSSVLSQRSLQPSNLVSCTDCDREFSSYTAFRVHHTKSHQSSINRQQHNHSNQRKSNSRRNSNKLQ
ncbi:unnamed protein product [Schistosoma guineensis]|nr:unnamed protein product [Schistosoma guineensis]